MIGQIDVSESSRDGDCDEHDRTATQKKQHPQHGGTSALSSGAQILAPVRAQIELISAIRSPRRNDREKTKKLRAGFVAEKFSCKTQRNFPVAVWTAVC
jgi:hypothetical protein